MVGPIFSPALLIDTPHNPIALIIIALPLVLPMSNPLTIDTSDMDLFQAYMQDMVDIILLCFPFIGLIFISYPNDVLFIIL